MTLNVSVVIPTVNRATVRMAVASVLHQTYPPFEVIVVVDNTDRSVHPALDDVLGKIRLVYTGGIGLAGARLRGTMEARGEAVAYLDDDDEWFPEKLERQVALWPTGHESRRHTVVSCGVIMLAHNGQPLRSAPSRVLSEEERVASYLFRRTTLGYGEGLLHPSSLICDRTLIDVEPWDPTVRRHEDWDWLLRVGARSDVAVRMCPEVLVKVAAGGMSLRGNWQLSLRWLQERAGQLTPRERGDFLLCHTATSAVRSRSRRGGLIAAGQALRCGRPGFTAWLVWALHMLSPGMVDRASRLRSRLTRV